jgi:hypothetical protein
VCLIRKGVWHKREPGKPPDLPESHRGNARSITAALLDHRNDFCKGIHVTILYREMFGVSFESWPQA